MTVEWGAAFLLGLLGSAHCVGMCGPIALALSGGQASRARFVAGRCAYNAGRVATYAAIGIPFGLFGQALRMAGLQQALSIAAGVVLMLGAIAYAGAGHWWHPSGTLANWTGGMKRLWGRLILQRSLPALFATGLLNGLLPCGLVYAALVGAAATGSAGGGALFMLVFGLGTFPAMLAVSLAGHLLQARVRRILQPMIPVGLAVVAGLLIVRGLGLGIPYLSPAFQNNAPHSCCHREPQAVDNQ